MYLDLQTFRPVKGFKIEGQRGEALFAMTIWGEARGESWDARVGVANVVLNRADADLDKWWFDSRYLPVSERSPYTVLAARVKAAVLKRWQFSIFNEGDPNREKLLTPWDHDEPKVWEECVGLAALAMERRMRDNTRGSDHYHSIPASQVDHWPKWAKGRTETVKIGSLWFYRLET